MNGARGRAQDPPWPIRVLPCRAGFTNNMRRPSPPATGPMLFRIVITASVSLALLLVVLTGCFEAPPLLRIGTNQWPGYEPLYLARANGAYADAPIQLIELPSSSDVMQQLRGGVLEGGALTLDETLTLISEGVDLVVVLIMDVSNGADALLAKPGIEQLADLRGHALGVELSAVGAVMLDAVLEAGKLKMDDLSIVSVPVDRHLHAFETGRVDALITFEPNRSLLLDRGAKLLFDSSRIPGRIVDVLAIRRAALRDRSDGLRQLLRGYFAARALMRSDPAGSARRMAPRLKLNAEQLLVAYRGLILPDLEENRRWLGGRGARILPIARHLAELMLNHGLISRLPELRDFHSDAWLPGPP